MAGASIDELAKEREGAPLSFPHFSGPFFLFFPSFFVAALSTGSAIDINDHGQVVGSFFERRGGEQHAFIYDITADKFHDLNELIVDGEEWAYLSNATGINENGQIVGWGYVGSDIQAYILTPVPAPTTIFLFVSGLIGLAGIKRKQGNIY